jgi:hypothetical protein
VVSEKSIWQRITNDRKKATYMCRRVVTTNNLVFSFFLQTNILIGYLTVGDGRSKFEVVCCFFQK